MKQLTCEMCGSADLMKQDGVFVCQTCGCKYSVEEARKMLIEGKVDVSGSTVKVDKSETTERYRMLARRSREQGDDKTAARYYEQVLIEEPNDWEATFYAVYCDAQNIKLKDIGAAAERVGNCTETTLRLICSTLDGVEKDVAVDVVSHEVLDYALLIIQNTSKNLGSDRDTKLRRINEWVIPAIQMLALSAYYMIDIANEYTKSRQRLNTCMGYVEQLQGLISPQKVKELKAFVLAAHALADKRLKEEKQQKIDKYWEEHSEEKDRLESKLRWINDEIAELNAQVCDSESLVRALTNERDKKLPCDEKVDEQRVVIRHIEEMRDKLGIFKRKEKKALQDSLDIKEMPKLNQLVLEAERIKKEHVGRFNAQIGEAKREGDKLRNKIAELQKQRDEINKELTKER